MSSTWRVVRVERLVPAQSRVWLELGLMMIAVAAGAALAALTASGEARVGALELWTLAGALLVQALFCFGAHWDVNRGRGERRSEVDESGR